MAEAITPNFKNQEEKNIVMATIGISLLLGFSGYFGVIAPIVAYFGLQNKLSGAGKEIIRRLANFEIVICLICLLLSITVIGIPLVIVAGIYGLIITLIALFAVMNNEPVNIPVFVEFIKESSITPITPQNNPEAPKDEPNP